MNQSPNGSPTATTSSAKTIWTNTAQRKIAPKREPPLPSSKVMKRDIAEDSAPEIIENMATTPPTTLYTP